ncbi:MAG: recombinase family protein [Chitinophagales bacterium]|nr:recombinase family protein [Chitinophagaceae bacterium]MCB9064085.1 recombinase family protein [Chitinophagales bacterium]
MAQTKKVGIWIRVSTDFQVKDDSPEHHERRARMYAESKNWKVAEIYRLEAVSGKSVMGNAEAKRMLRDLQSGKIEALIFSKLARLARNTKELLEFSEIFRENNADLISLSENIDTSSSAGRLFYTMIAAMAEWERQEISERVAASVPIRAKMGKPLGGQAPFGYRWEDKELVIHEKEAPIRKLMYELYVEHKRKGTVASLLNKKGYRTRKGAKFSDTTIGRLLTDPIAKGQRRANYTKSTGEGKHWEIKPESEWVIISCPAIVTEDLWNECNRIIESQTYTRKPTRKTIHPFAGILLCDCGGKMYVPSRVKKYVCQSCKKTNISTEDIDHIYFEQLKSFLLTKDDIAIFLHRAEDAIQSKETELQSLSKEKTRIKSEMDNLIKLHSKGQIPTDDFGSYYTPLSEQYKQIDLSLADLEAQVDFIKVQQLDGDHILENAENLYDKWPTLDNEAKRQIVEELTESIQIGKEEITIKFNYTPTLTATPENTPTTQHNHKGSYLPPT